MRGGGGESKLVGGAEKMENGKGESRVERWAGGRGGCL